VATSVHPEISEPTTLLGVPNPPVLQAVGAAPQPAGGGFKAQNDGGRFLDVIIDITNVGAGPGTLTVTIDGQDPASGKWYNLLTSAVLSAVATTVLRVGVGLTPVANQAVSLPVPKVFRVVPTVGVNPIAFTVGFNLCP
jgi:hypothetical protein